jgi:hypothetical protein
MDDDGRFLLIASAGLAFLAVVCFFFPGFGKFVFYWSAPDGDRGIAYVFASFSAILLLIELGRLVGLFQSN